jgi:hypothetical protein
MASLQFSLHAAGVLAPGMTSLAQLRAICRGDEAHIATPLVLPSPAMLPTNERRRASPAVRLALACIAQALQDSPFPGESLRSVFATDEGTGEVCQQMLEALAITRQVSPLLFPNSVQNAPSGYFSIAWRNRQPATVVSLGLESFASGLVCAVAEASACHQPVLLVVYDPVMTSPLDELLPVAASTATAWVISCGAPGGTMPVLGSFEMALQPAAAQRPSELAPWLPASWAAHSSARALDALGLLEAGPETVLRLTLGGQMLTLRRTAGAAA